MYTSRRRPIASVLLLCLVLLSSAAGARAQDPAPTETPIAADAPVEPAAEATATLEPVPGTPEVIDPNAQPTDAPTAIIEVVATPAPIPTEPPAELESAQPGVHSAQPGETLDSIAALAGISPVDLAQANHLTHRDLIFAGQKLTLPAGAVRTEPGRVHYVTPGDTLLSIAAAYAVAPAALAQANALGCDGCIVPGQILRVPGAPGPDRVASSLPGPFEHISITPRQPRQGDMIVISITTALPLQSLVGTLAGRAIYFVQKNGAYLALSGVGAVQDTGVYSLALRALTAEGVPARLEGRVQVMPGKFGFENLVVGPRLVPLLAIDVNLEERAALDGIYNRNFTGAQYWRGPFRMPVDNAVISYFGTRRDFNHGTLDTFHSGIDIPAHAGSPVAAAGAGKVIATQTFPIRGNVVIIDHGRSVFTVYCHLSRFKVSVGDLVNAGDVIGLAGSTGRSLGPHVHFEMAVGGVTVNPLPLVAREIP